MRYRRAPDDIVDVCSSRRLPIEPTYVVMATPAELDLLLRSPAIPPPPGVTPNLVDPPVYGFETWLVTASVSLTVTTILVVIRVYTRLYVSRNHAWEDCKPVSNRIRLRRSWF